MNNSLKCSVSNPLQVYVILESCRFNSGAVQEKLNKMAEYEWNS